MALPEKHRGRPGEGGPSGVMDDDPIMVTRWCCQSLDLTERATCARFGIGCDDAGRCARAILDGRGGGLDAVE